MSLSPQGPKDNYELIAMMVTSFYCSLARNEACKTWSEDQLLFACALLDTRAYLADGSLSIQDIQNTVFYSQAGECAIFPYSVKHRGLLDYEENPLLVGLIMQICALITFAELHVPVQAAVDSVIPQKNRIAEVVSGIKLAFSSSPSLPPFISEMISSAVSDPHFVQLVTSFSL